MYRLTITFILSLFILTATSQIECLDLHDTTAVVPLNKSSVSEKVIPLYVHIFTADELPYSQITENQVIETIDTLNANFNEFEIYFELQNVDYINLDTVWNEVQYQTLVLGDGIFVQLQQNGYIETLAELVSVYPEENANIFVYPNFYPDQPNGEEGLMGFSWVPPFGSMSNPNGEFNSADGVWINSKVFPINGEYNIEGKTEGKTVVHEFGHYCGLYHIFQGFGYSNTCIYGILGNNPITNLHQEQGYLYGDLVNDTPPIGANFSCSTPNCNAPPWAADKHWSNYTHTNHMDYYEDACRLNFTEGQISRMHSYLEVYRPNVFNDQQNITCIGDFNNDQFVGTYDILEFLSCLGEEYEGCEFCDFDNNQYIGTFDLLVLLSYYGEPCGTNKNYIHESSWEKNSVKTLLYKKLQNQLQQSDLELIIPLQEK